MGCMKIQKDSQGRFGLSLTLHRGRLVAARDSDDLCIVKGEIIFAINGTLVENKLGSAEANATAVWNAAAVNAEVVDILVMWDRKFTDEFEKITIGNDSVVEL